jgi:hypothetical protein
MERPRFQFDTGMSMMVVTIVAALLALVITTDFLTGAIAIQFPYLLRWIVDRHIWSQCRAEGREPEKADRIKAESITMRLLIPLVAPISIGGIIWVIFRP